MYAYISDSIKQVDTTLLQYLCVNVSGQKYFYVHLMGLFHTGPDSSSPLDAFVTGLLYLLASRREPEIVNAL